MARVSLAVRAWSTRIVLTGVAALAIGCGSRASAPTPTLRPLRAEGRELFAREHCGDCHALAAVGARGRGGGPDFDTSERLSRAQLRAALLEGANGMPSYAGRLAPRQLDALAAFLFAATHARDHEATGRRPVRSPS